MKESLLVIMIGKSRTVEIDGLKINIMNYLGFVKFVMKHQIRAYQIYSTILEYLKYLVIVEYYFE